jgi:predicted dehydrogenase
VQVDEHPLAEQPLRLAMIGGGPGAFIGPVHAMAARLDGRWNLVAGAFSRDPALNQSGAAAYGVAPERCYDDWRALIAAEVARSDGVQAVAIVTPNHLHVPIATMAAEAGLAVISDKPAATSLAEASALRRTLARRRGVYALTHTYAGYPMVRAMRNAVAKGVIGPVRKVTASYTQGWLAEAIENDGNRQADWRTDPAKSGAGGTLGDIGVHAFHLVEYISGHLVTRVLADISTLVSGRQLDDDANVLFRLDNDAPGVLTVSQVATGEVNDLRIRVHGDLGTLGWANIEPERMTHLDADGEHIVHHSGMAGTGVPTRLPAGHGEGFIEAFATLYCEFADVVAGSPHPATLPGIDDGVRGMAFIEAALRSSRAQCWTHIDALEVLS